MRGWIAIAAGDMTGIGPEVTLKALAEVAGRISARFLILGDAAWLRRWNDRLGLGLALLDHSAGGEAGQIFIHNPLEALPDQLPSGSPVAAQRALGWLREAACFCLRQEADALVTAPLNKQSVLRLGEPFVGQTEFLSRLAGTDRTAMMLLGGDEAGRMLRVGLATTHAPLRQVAQQLSSERIIQVIELSAQACRDLGLPRARVGVCALNPHAGEGGQLGDEEVTLIGPAVAATRDRGLDVWGPFAADTLFYQAYSGQYDALVAMYHDQGLVPLKMIGFETGVNWTLGLPFVRTSPDHGTAYDIAGKGKANPRSMRAAIELAWHLIQRASAPPA